MRAAAFAHPWPTTEQFWCHNRNASPGVAARPRAALPGRSTSRAGRSATSTGIADRRFAWEYDRLRAAHGLQFVASMVTTTQTRRALRWLSVGTVVSWCGVGAFFLFGRSGSAAGAGDPGGRFRYANREKHYVTLPQLAESGAMRAFRLQSREVVDSSGTRREWREVLGGRPALVVFIKKDCPCSVEFEPYFQNLVNRYRDRVSFVGVFDGAPRQAREYAAANRVAYPIVADEKLDLVRAFMVKNGGYVGLIGRDGAVETLWPGFSVSMMGELNAAVARAAGVATSMVETRGLPAALTTGCPYELNG